MASTIHSRRVGGPVRRWAAGLVLLAGAAAGCSTGGHTSSPTTSLPVTPTTAVTPTTRPGPQTSGPRTVLSPVGLNVRADPSTSAHVLGSAAEGVVLTVLGYTSSGGGWFKVKGATVTGWITAKPTLSAAGEFHSYASSTFAALYPSTWTEAAVPPRPGLSSVSFRPASGPGDIVVTTAGNLGRLPHGRAGYDTKSVTPAVACGITAGLVVFEQAGTSPNTSPPTSVPESLTYLAEFRFAVDKQHAFGVYADLLDLGPTFQIFNEFVASLTFSAPQCTG